MNRQSIPSLLQGKLQERSQEATATPLVIEVGEHVVPYAVERSQNIAINTGTLSKSRKEMLASNPTVLLLLPQENLDSFVSDTKRSDFTVLSEEQTPRDDLSVLDDRTLVLATTPMRAIDHIRRDNILLSRTLSVVVAYHFLQGSEETEEQLHVREQAFLDDCRFVFTKLNRNTRIELFIDELSHLARAPEELVEQHTLISRADWEQSDIHVSCYPSSLDATESILDILYVMQAHTYTVVHKGDAAWRRLERKLRTSIPSIGVTKIDYNKLTSASKRVKEEVGTVVAFGLTSGETTTLIREMLEWENHPQSIVCITEPHIAEEIITSKETLLMNTEKRSIPEPDEVVAGKIEMLVAKLAIDSHPEELENLRKLFKKHVPFHRRGYFTAYLLREVLGAEKRSGSTAKQQTAAPKAKESATVKSKDANSSNDSDRQPNRAKRQSPKAKSRDIPEGARTLYLNIGKMRRLYAKELSQILQDQLGVTRDDIFAIRVHDKYSFITLSQEHADLAIEKLNGMDIRGRTAAVSYSNKE
ncbi:MAG TPA: DbpA RNA binding domain-containing protein [Sphaerochaetaceae bacterium]|nr:DbpA RNA binding domain-containing protein [Sphaerochaetaceae bacterium]